MEDAETAGHIWCGMPEKQSSRQPFNCKAARVALNSGPWGGDQLAVWRLGHGIAEEMWMWPRFYRVAISGLQCLDRASAFIKCSPEQLRLRILGEREADRCLLRDLRLAAANL